jgi:hypothetical protein
MEMHQDLLGLVVKQQIDHRQKSDPDACGRN